MRIGIDARLYSQTGIGVYLRNLIYFLQQIDRVNQYFIYLIKDDFDKLRLSERNFIKRLADYRWHTFSEQVYFYQQLTNDKLNLMHFTYFGYPVLYKKNYIATIHDLTPLLIKTGKASTKNPIVYQVKYWVFKQILKAQAANAKIIITPSQAVKNQLIDVYRFIDPSKINPIYEGVSYELIYGRENFNLEKKYHDNFFIYVGNFYPHKNIERLLQAFRLAMPADYRLILIGPADYFANRVKQLIKQTQLENRVVVFHPQSTADILFFYRRAKALIHPSLSEGFGLPVVEACYFKLPVIASSIPVFKEILEDDYIAFNPESVNAIAKAIIRFIQQPPKLNYERINAKFSYKKMAIKTLELYQMND